MAMKRAVLAVVAVAVGVRVVRSRHQRSLHPAGRSFTGDLVVWGSGRREGAALLDQPGRHPIVVRISKGVGTRGGRADVRGVAVRVLGDQPLDLLFSTSGEGRFTRHLPTLRRSFDTFYGSILPYRLGGGRKVYLSARPDRSLGRAVSDVVEGSLVLFVDERAFGVVTFGGVQPPEVDAALAFDPVRNTRADLHPTGVIHMSRAVAYRLSQRWRGVVGASSDPEAVARTALRG
jgi:hypothetical protein